MNTYTTLLNQAVSEVDSFVEKGDLQLDRKWYDDFKYRLRAGASSATDEKAEEFIDALGWIWSESGLDGIDLAPSLDKALEKKCKINRMRHINNHKNK